MNKKGLILIVLISFVITGCVDRNSRMIQTLYGHKIDLSWDMNYLGQTHKMVEKTDNLYRIVTRVDSSFCTPCLINYLKAAESYMEKLNCNSVEFICFIQPKSLVDLEEGISEIDLSNLVLVHDPSNNYSKVNGLEKFNSLVSSFLIDMNNKIVLIGDPLRNSEVKSIYDDYFKKTIKKNLSEYE